MANNLLAELLELPRPNTLSKEDLKFYLDQLNIFEPNTKEFSKIEKTFTDLGYKIPPNYLGVVISNWYENFTEIPKYEQADQTEVPQYEAQNQTVLDSSTLEQLEKEADASERQRQETIENSKRAVEEAQQKLREIKTRNDEILRRLENQKGKKLYVEIKSPAEEQFTKEESLDYENYKEYLKSVKPDEIPEAVEKLAQEMENRIGENLKKQGLNEDDIKLVTENTAAEVIDNLIKSDEPSYVPSTHSVAVADFIVKNPEEVNKITEDKKTQSLIKENSRFTTPETLLQGYSRTVTEATFGPKFASHVFGPKPETLTVNISETPQPTYTETYTPYVAARSAQISLENQDQNLEELKQRGFEEGKRVLVRDARSLIRNRLELIHPQSAAGRFLQSNQGEYFLRAFGVGPQDGLSLIEKIGVNYGIGITSGAKMAIWAKTTTQTAMSIANTGGIMQMEAYLGGAVYAPSKVATGVGIKAGLGGLFAKGAAALGVSLGAFTFGVSTAITIVLTAIGKILEKIDWAKVKSWLKDNGPIILLGGGLLLGGPAWGIGLGLGGLALAGKFTALGIARGTWRFFRRIGTFFLITIGTPFIVTLIILPPVIAFIMFVINSGAYIVPPKPVAESGFSPGMGGYECREDRITTGLEYSVNSSIATRAREIVDDLYQGFWCFWNRSPKAPAPYFPNDGEPNFPPGYPDLFDYEAFLQNPNTTPPSQNLFWCTWLIQKAYTENGVKILNTLWSPDMKLDFESRGKFISASSVTSSNAVPGSVIFFDVDNEKDRIDHVGIIYSTNGDDVTYVQSNAGLKVEHLTLGSSGLQGKPGYIDVIGIGLP